MMDTMGRRWLTVLMASLLLFLGGCNSPQEAANVSPAAADVGETSGRRYALIVKSVENPYMLTMYDGFSTACDLLGATAELYGGASTGEQAGIVMALVESGVDAIAIAANDMDEVSASLRAALDAGIPVVSLDSVVRETDRLVHIQQASPEIIGRVLIQACAQMMHGSGEFAILTTTDAMPNQASWVRWMQRELENGAGAYADMQLVEVCYGLDEHTVSVDETARMLREHPDLAMIIAPTSVGMRAAAEAIEAAGAVTRLTGLGLPSEMAPYIESGLCPWMYLWNPADVGTLAAYAMHALVGGEITGAADEVLSAGALGVKVIVSGEDGGTEIVLGNPMVFDESNIAAWAEVF